ncbi:MAG: hypothetical protein M3Y57_15825 [Acidobacteriota bacterium]|nr:hypothetical protein [Acidobacteriota bacterium]
MNFHQTRNDGIYNDRNIAGTTTKSLHAEGRALDIGLMVSRPYEKLIGDELFQAFIEYASQMGFQEIIWNRQIWSAAKPVVHPYTGHDPHTGHIHAGFTRPASQQTNFPGSFVMRIAAIRTGLEDLARANRNIA